MSDTLTTHLWMAGVMLIMVGYGAVAIIGLARRKSR
jgi:hypothetical protein